MTSSDLTDGDVCPMCGEVKPDVDERLDPYAADVHDAEVWLVCCGDCAYEQAGDT